MLAYASDALTPFAEDCVTSRVPPGIPTSRAHPRPGRGLLVYSCRASKSSLCWAVRMSSLGTSAASAMGGGPLTWAALSGQILHPLFERNAHTSVTLALLDHFCASSLCHPSSKPRPDPAGCPSRLDVTSPRTPPASAGSFSPMLSNTTSVACVSNGSHDAKGLAYPLPQAMGELDYDHFTPIGSCNCFVVSLLCRWPDLPWAQGQASPALCYVIMKARSIPTAVHDPTQEPCGVFLTFWGLVKHRAPLESQNALSV